MLVLFLKSLDAVKFLFSSLFLLTLNSYIALSLIVVIFSINFAY